MLQINKNDVTSIKNATSIKLPTLYCSKNIYPKQYSKKEHIDQTIIFNNLYIKVKVILNTPNVEQLLTFHNDHPKWITRNCNL